LLALENEGIAATPAPLDVFFVLAEGAERLDVLPVLAELRRAGVSADLDYAGRSVKGQLTQAGRTGARTVVIIRREAATIRREGLADVETTLAEVVARLTA
jgi:histidyl-tRNA synthetase